VAEVVKDMLSKERSRLGELSNDFMEGASKLQRELLKKIEDSGDRFDTRAKASLTERMKPSRDLVWR
jgi:DNA replication initiation complex subunit (GINS family)